MIVVWNELDELHGYRSGHRQCTYLAISPARHDHHIHLHGRSVPLRTPESDEETSVEHL